MEPMTTAGTAVSTAADQERKAPGRPRSARADGVIIDAVLEMLTDGYTADTLSIEAVAAKAGVGKATIYRRWPNKEALIVDAVASLKGPVPKIAGESVRDDLITLLTPMAHTKDNRTAKIMSCLMPELRRSSSLLGCYQNMVEARRTVMRDVVRRGMRTGELRPDLDVELALTLLSAPVIVQNMLHWNPALDTAGLPERVVDAVLAGIAVPQAGSASSG
jgi:AcrR family transcriptional regulator